MVWSQDEQRMLLQIERHLTDEDPQLAARLEAFNERIQRQERGRALRPRKHGRHAAAPRRLTAVVVVSWVLIATLIALLLVLVLRHEAAALPI